MRSTSLCIFEPLRDAKLTHRCYMHLEDLKSYIGGRRAAARGIYRPIRVERVRLS
jgi:hypothetical protein